MTDEVPLILPPCGLTCASNTPLVRIVGMILLSVLYAISDLTCGLKSPVSLKSLVALTALISVIPNVVLVEIKVGYT